MLWWVDFSEELVAAVSKCPEEVPSDVVLDVYTRTAGAGVPLPAMFLEQFAIK